jgi:hypothetical protein
MFINIYIYIYIYIFIIISYKKYSSYINWGSVLRYAHVTRLDSAEALGTQVLKIHSRRRYLAFHRNQVSHPLARRKVAEIRFDRQETAPCCARTFINYRARRRLFPADHARSVLIGFPTALAFRLQSWSGRIIALAVSGISLQR